MKNITFGENLRMLRLRANLTQKEVAEKLLISRQSVSKWEQNIALPITTFIVPLSKIYGCTLEELLIIDTNCVKKGG